MPAQLQALGCHGVQLGRDEGGGTAVHREVPAVLVKHAEVAPTHIVREYEKDIRTLLLPGLGERTSDRQGPGCTRKKLPPIYSFRHTRLRQGRFETSSTGCH